MIESNSADLAQLCGGDVKDALAKVTDAKRRQAIEATYQHHYDSALSLWEGGSKEQAVAQLEMALKGIPDRADRWCQLGEFYDALGSEALLRDDQREADRFREKAEAALIQASTLSPDFAKAHYALANVYWGRDSRMALAELEAAAKCDPHEYESVLERARTTVRECTYRLARMNVIVLGCAQEMPSTRMLETEFFFAEFRIGCAVMHTHVSDSRRQWAHVWLFESEHPNLNDDEPVAELTISSTGDVSISEGCPANYHALKAQAAELGVLSGWLGTNGPPASYISASEALVEDAGTRVAADQPEAPTAPDKLTASHPRMAPASNLGTPDTPRVRAPATRSDTSRIVTESPPPDVDTSRVLTPAAVEVPEKEITARVHVSSARSRRRILWACLGAVLVAAAAGQFYFENVGAARTSDDQADVSVESPGLLPQAASDAVPESDGTAALEPVLLNSETPTAGSEGPDSSATVSSADPVPITPPVQPLNPARQQARKAIDPRRRPSISEPVETEATQVTVFDPPRRPATKEPIVAEANQAPRAQLPAESAMDRMRRELAQCGQMGFLQRGICMERTRWNHCHPDNWNKTPECAVQ